MPRIEQLFKLRTANAAGFRHYRPGDVAYVTNGFRNNGVIGYVAPAKDDAVFKFVELSYQHSAKRRFRFRRSL